VRAGLGGRLLEPCGDQLDVLAEHRDLPGEGAVVEPVGRKDLGVRTVSSGSSATRRSSAAGDSWARNSWIRCARIASASIALTSASTSAATSSNAEGVPSIAARIDARAARLALAHPLAAPRARRGTSRSPSFARRLKSISVVSSIAAADA
jgi:hypothetical protein